MADDEKKNHEFKRDNYVITGECFLRQKHFKIIHVSNLDAYSPNDQFINESLQLINNDYSLVTLKDRSKLPDNLFNEYDVVLLSVWSGINEEKLGNLVANAVDAGKNVVILLFSNSASHTHPKGRFMSENYNATTREGCQSKAGNLGKIYKPDHPIMTNVNAITLGNEKRRSMGKIPETKQNSVDRIADWNDGNVLVAVRNDKSGLITEITSSFGVNATASDAKQLLNNALRLDREFVIKIPMNIINVISKSNFDIIQKIQEQFSSDETALLKLNWDNVFNDISSQFEKILNSTFDKISKQVKDGTQQQINVLTNKKTNCLKEIENAKIKYQQMDLPEETIKAAQAPLLKYVESLQTKIDQWKNVQINTNKLVNSKNK
eukprot:120249_1